MKTIIITGASSGIGRATVDVFLNAGWTVGMIARRAEKLAEVDHPNAIALPADVTDAPALQAAFDSFVDKTGQLDALFNNAGIFGPAAHIDEIDPAAWEQVMLTNLHGMFLSARLAYGQMRRQSPQGGRIINNGSLSAYTPRAFSVCYTTTKHAITGLTKTLSLDGREFGIACGQLDIGNAETDMVAALKANKPDMPTMDVTHAADAVLHMAELPLSANVQFMTVMATTMPYIGRG